MLLNGLIELRNVNPQIVLSSFDSLRAAVTCALQSSAATPQFSSLYYEPPQTLLPAPPVLQTINCSSLNGSFPTATTAAPLPGGRAAVWYTFPNTSQIMSMNLVEFNTLMTYSPYIQAYKQIVGSTGIIAAGPAELLHLPGPVPYLPIVNVSESLGVSLAAFAFLMLILIATA